MNTKIKKWLKENSMIIVLLGLFFVVPVLLRTVDETAAAFDAGILHSVVLVCVIFAIYQACTWSIVKTIWPDVGIYFKTRFSSDYNLLNGKYRLLVALSVYFTILLTLTLLTCAIL